MTSRRIMATPESQTSTFDDRTRTVDIAASRTVFRNRRMVRDEELVQAVQRLDAATDAAYAEALIAWIRERYEERQGGSLVGLFSRCYLGAPYVDHRLDLVGGSIVEHYEGHHNPPPPFDQARPLARSDAYAYIEVYSDGAIVPVREDGKAVV